MKVLHLDCSMGAAGDMLAGALLGLLDGPGRAAALAAFNSFGLPHTVFGVETLSKNGIAALRLRVEVRGEEEAPHRSHGHGHAHRHLTGVNAVLDSLEMPEAAKEAAKEVYLSIAAAEARAHGVPVEEVHFHETGALDAIADVAAVCWLMDALKPGETIVSPVNTGSGSVECAHGTLPVPAPATAFLLEGVPAYSDGTTVGELTTPTGAALLRRFADRFGARPAMAAEATSFGCGKKDFKRANVLAAYFGERSGGETEAREIAEISFNVDDMTGEDLAFAAERIFEAGALDVFFTPALMKKGRPGHLATVLCEERTADRIFDAVFAHTTTIGLRWSVRRRMTLAREKRVAEAPDGSLVGLKTSRLPDGSARSKFEADDLAGYAKRKSVSLAKARRDLTAHARIDKMAPEKWKGI